MTDQIPSITTDAPGGDAIRDAVNTVRQVGERRHEPSRTLMTGSRHLGPAYAFGIDAYHRYRDHRFEDVEPVMAAEWDAVRGDHGLTWKQAKHAVRDAWKSFQERDARQYEMTS